MRTARDVYKRLLAPPKEWRTEPQLFGIPAPNQTFSRYARSAGFEGVLYPFTTRRYIVPCCVIMRIICRSGER